MTINHLISTFAHDDQTKTVLVLIVLDLVLGVCAAVKLGTFALSYIANFARNDVLAKVIPFFAVYSAGLVAPNVSVGIDQANLANLSDLLFVAVAGALVGSLVSSLSDLGFPLPAKLGRGGQAGAVDDVG